MKVFEWLHHSAILVKGVESVKFYIVTVDNIRKGFMGRLEKMLWISGCMAAERRISWEIFLKQGFMEKM